MENEFKGTKGQWEVTNVNFPNQISIGTDRETICQTSIAFSKHKKQTAKSNAQLISKAPEMLEMLISVLELQKENYGNGMSTHLALISKAKKIENLIKEATTI